MIIIRIVKKLINTLRYGTGVSLKNVYLGKKVYIAHHAELMDTVIGDHSSIGRFDKIRNTDIGKYCSISWNCNIGAPAHPFKTLSSCALTYRKEYGVVEQDIIYPQKKTIIGHDVWLGCDVTVLAGVSIGNGAVIGAGAVVTQNVPPYEIWAGVPAKKISNRFDEIILERVKKIEWWDWTLEEQRKCLDLFKKDVNEQVIKDFEIRIIKN